MSKNQAKRIGLHKVGSIAAETEQRLISLLHKLRSDHIIRDTRFLDLFLHFVVHDGNQAPANISTFQPTGRRKVKEDAFTYIPLARTQACGNTQL